MAVSKLSRAFIDEQTTIGDYGSPVARSVPLHDSQMYGEFETWLERYAICVTDNSTAPSIGFIMRVVAHAIIT
jgi:hypothetical protein